jgi:hypothetical protein
MYPCSKTNSSAADSTGNGSLLTCREFNRLIDTCFHTQVVTDIALPEPSTGDCLRRFLEVQNRDTGAVLGKQLCRRETKSRGPVRQTTLVRRNTYPPVTINVLPAIFMLACLVDVEVEIE